MKESLLGIFVAIILFLIICINFKSEASASNNTVNEVKKESKSSDFEITEFEYNGHSYIFIEKSLGQTVISTGGVVHNPDCKCKKNF